MFTKHMPMGTLTTMEGVLGALKDTLQITENKEENHTFN
jgi:C4-type Zn-finger protein